MNIVTGIALGLGLAACGRAGDPPVQAPPPAAVLYQVATPRDVPVTFEYVGQTSGSREVEIRARVNGIVEKRLYEEGGRVRAGQPLFQIESALYAAAAAQTEAAAASAQAELKLAEREHARLQPLADAKAISQQAWDAARARLDLARAQYRQAQAKHASASVELGYTRVTAPLTGVAGRALKMEGALVNAANDGLLTTLAQIDPIHVNFAIPEQEQEELKSALADGSLRLAKPGYVVRLKTSGGNWLKPGGRLNFSDYKADAGTGTYAARAEFPNPDGSLAPGQMVRVVLTGAVRPQAIAVPQRAVLDGAQGKFVYVVGQGRDGTPVAEARTVVPGEWVPADAAGQAGGWVIRSGLRAGDRVIVDGMARLGAPGVPVQATAAHAADGAAATLAAARAPGAGGG